MNSQQKKQLTDQLTSQTTMKGASWCLLFTVLLMELLGGAEVDIFVPSFPDLQKTFDLTPFMVELTLGLNLASQCFTSLIVGNLGDRYGRRPIILIGLVIFLIGSLFCVFAGAYWHMLFGRILQGIGISGPIVLSYVVIADLYSTEKQQQIMGTMNGITTLGMACAPVVGSYVNYYYSWQGNFVVLLILSAVCFISGVLFLPKGQKNPSVSLSLKEYIPILQTKTTFYYIAFLMLLVQGYWIFIGMSPLLYMGELGVSLTDFGFYQGALAGAFAVISLSAPYLLPRFGQRNCFAFSMFSLVLFMIAMPILMVFNVRSPLLITGVMLLEAAGLIFPITILWPLMLETIPGALSRISAVATAVRLLLTAFSIQLASYLYDGTIWSLGAVMWGFIALALFAGYRLFQIDKVFKEPSGGENGDESTGECVEVPVKEAV